MNLQMPAPLPDGRYRPGAKVRTMGTVGVGITIAFAIITVLAALRDLSNPTQLVGVFISGAMTLFFALISYAFVSRLRRATLVVDAGGLTVPVLLPTQATGGPFRTAWSELGPAYLLWADDQRTPMTSSLAARAVIPGTRFFQLALTNRDERMLAVFMMPAWPENMTLGLAARIQVETARPMTAFPVQRLPLPGTFGDRFTVEDAQNLQRESGL